MSHGFMVGLLVEAAGFAAFGDLCEEVVAFVVDKDECGEVFNFDFPDCFHAEFGVFEKFNVLDRVLCEHGGGSAD